MAAKEYHFWKIFGNALMTSSTRPEVFNSHCPFRISLVPTDNTFWATYSCTSRCRKIDSGIASKEGVLPHRYWYATKKMGKRVVRNGPYLESEIPFFHNELLISDKKRCKYIFTHILNNYTLLFFIDVEKSSFRVLCESIRDPNKQFSFRKGSTAFIQIKIISWSPVFGLRGLPRNPNNPAILLSIE